MLRDIAKGSAWMIAVRFADRSLGVISTVLLARCLVPHDFGLIAMAMSVIVILELCSVFSFDIALIQASAPTADQYNSAFTLNVLFRSSIAVAMVLLAIPAANFYDEPRLAGVLYGLSVGWLALAFENIGVVSFRRDMQFKGEFAFQTTKRIVSFVVTVALAFAFRSYWALVAGMVVGRVVGLIMSYALVDYRPRFTLTAARELMSFSVWLLLNNILHLINTRLSSLVVGKVSGSHALGLYNISREIGTLPSSELLVPIERALIAGYSRMASNPETLREGFLAVLAAVTLVALPAAVGVVAVAEPLVVNLLSRAWVDAIPYVQVLSFLGAVSALGSNTYPAYVSMGKPHIATCFAITRLLILVPAMIVLAHWMGPIGAAWAEMVVALVLLPIGWYVLCQVLRIPMRIFASHLWRPLLGSMFMYLVVREYLITVTGGMPVEAAPVELLGAVLVGILSYCSLVVLLWCLSGRPHGIEVQIARRVQLRLRLA